MQFTKVKTDAFETLQMNAGIIVDAFNPATGVIGNILGATTGGFTFATNPNFSDFGEDVDNCPANTWQMKRILSYDPSASGTFLTVTPGLAKTLVAAGAVSDTTKITPSHKLTQSDFNDIWIVGDYSDENEGASTAGYVAVHIMNALNTAGFQWTSAKDGKGQFAFEFHGHYDYDNIDTVPFEIYVKAGTTAVAPSIRLNTKSFTVADEATQQLVATTVPAGQTVTWSSVDSTTATVSDGLVTGKNAGNTIITASMTYSGVTYTDTCTVIVTA